MNFTLTTTEMFFDREKILRRMNAKTAKVLSSTGAYSRKIMSGEMKRRKGISAPNGFPSAHGRPLLKQIFFGFDTTKEELVVGPRKLQGRGDPEVAAAGFTVPQLINEGGTVLRRKVYDAKRKRIARLRPNRAPIAWHYKPRPFVALTLPKAAKKLADNMAEFGF